MKFLAAAVSLLLSVPLAAQTWTATFSYTRPGLNVPHWQIEIPAAGNASYTGKPAQGADPGVVSFPLSVAGRDRLGTLLQQSHHLQPCETKSKGIANMGQKDVTFTPQGGEAEHCSFNFTENKPLGEAAEYFAALANTLQTGLELQRLHRYDRLGLDAVMRRLANDVKEHHAVEIGAIEPALKSLAEDEALMDRVRARAEDLLALAAAEAQK